MTRVTTTTFATSKPLTMPVLTSSLGSATRESMNDNATTIADAVVSTMPHGSLRGAKVTNETADVMSSSNRNPARYESSHVRAVNAISGAASSTIAAVRTQPATFKAKHPSHTAMTAPSTSAAGHKLPPSATRKKTSKGRAVDSATMRY